eukprot:c652_g1_i1.p1 GENE.c652_g1_i1~~c652_g1_i1.p1  ORF type:complete len:420 (-),score=87.37 c652_g1_i1:70-1272(-)
MGVVGAVADELLLHAVPMRHLIPRRDFHGQPLSRNIHNVSNHNDSMLVYDWGNTSYRQSFWVTVFEASAIGIAVFIVFAYLWSCRCCFNGFCGRFSRKSSGACRLLVVNLLLVPLAIACLVLCSVTYLSDRGMRQAKSQIVTSLIAQLNQMTLDAQQSLQAVEILVSRGVLNATQLTEMQYVKSNVDSDVATSFAHLHSFQQTNYHRFLTLVVLSGISVLVSVLVLCGLCRESIPRSWILAVLAGIIAWPLATVQWGFMGFHVSLSVTNEDFCDSIDALQWSPVAANALQYFLQCSVPPASLVHVINDKLQFEHSACDTQCASVNGTLMRLEQCSYLASALSSQTCRTMLDASTVTAVLMLVACCATTLLAFLLFWTYKYLMTVAQVQPGSPSRRYSRVP